MAQPSVPRRGAHQQHQHHRRQPPVLNSGLRMPEGPGALNSFPPGVVPGTACRAKHDCAPRNWGQLCAWLTHPSCLYKAVGSSHTRWHRLHTRAISLHRHLLGVMTDICFLHSLCEREVLTSSVTLRATKDSLPRASCSRPERSCLRSGHRRECSRKQPARRESGEAEMRETGPCFLWKENQAHLLG